MMKAHFRVILMAMIKIHEGAIKNRELTEAETFFYPTLYNVYKICILVKSGVDLINNNFYSQYWDTLLLLVFDSQNE